MAAFIDLKDYLEKRERGWHALTTQHHTSLSPLSAILSFLMIHIVLSETS